MKFLSWLAGLFVVPEAPPKAYYVEQGVFRSGFTYDELVACFSLPAKVSPYEGARVRAALDAVFSPHEVDLLSPETEAAIMLFASHGAMTRSRALAILNKRSSSCKSL